MRFLVVVSALISLTASASPPTAAFSNSSQWLRAVTLVTSLVDSCAGKLKHLNMSQVSGMRLCLKVKAFQSLDRALSQDIIPLGQAMELVRDRTLSERGYCNMTAQEILQDEPQDLLLDRVATVLDTHVLRFKIPQDGQDHVTQSAKSRIRRHHRHMFPLMVVGFMTMAAFLVPLGFQFMAMLGGKALLLSKIALMMSSFQGLKKVPPYDPYHHGHLHYHDRSYQENRRAMESAAPRLTQQQHLMVSPALTTTTHALTQALEKSPDSQHMQNLVYALLPSNQGQNRDLGQTAADTHDQQLLLSSNQRQERDLGQTAADTHDQQLLLYSNQNI